MKPMYKKGGNKENAMKNTKKEKDSYMLENIELDFEKESMGMGGKMKYKSAGFPDLNKDGELTQADILKGRGVIKKTGGKSMEPGGGGRFAAMVSGLKKKGKSEDSAKAIAASIGRKKYGKSKFQEMAAAGKKKMMGGKKC